MKIAVEGCAHGELDKIYESLAIIENENNIHIDLLIICGDFQAVRNPADLQCMAVPPKYRKLNTFYKYYSGEKLAPVLTVFVGGNHEASNYLSEIPFGGWVCTNIYYMGFANVINVGGIRIAGISGIYKGGDYMKGHFEYLPYNSSTVRSVYHIRNIDVFRLKQINQPVDICISHDWPRGIYNYGNMAALLKKKPFFRDEMESNKLGNPPAMELLEKLKPCYWFAAHLHCKFAAIVPHDDPKKPMTKFLALDKCLPHRNFLQVLDIPSKGDVNSIQYDTEWLCILKNTQHLSKTSRQNTYMPGPGGDEKWDFSVSEEELQNMRTKFNNDMEIPRNFVITAPIYTTSDCNKKYVVKFFENPQTQTLCQLLNMRELFGIAENVSANLSISDFNCGDTDTSYSSIQSLNPSEITLSEDDENNSSSYITENNVSDINEFFIDKTGSHQTSKNIESIESNEFFIDRSGSYTESSIEIIEPLNEENADLNYLDDNTAEDENKLNLSLNAQTFLQTQFCSTPVAEKPQEQFPELKRLSDNENSEEQVPGKKLKRRNWSLYNSDSAVE